MNKFFHFLKTENTRVGLILIILSITLFSCGEKKMAGYLVMVEDQGVPMVTMERRYKLTREFAEIIVITPGQIKKFLNEYFVPDLLFLAGAYDQGLDQDPEMLKMLDRTRESLLTGGGGTLAKAILPTEFNFSDDDLQIWYQQSETEYQAAHVLVNSKFVADSLHGLLLEGAEFEKIVQENSFDYRSIEMGGLNPQYFSIGMMGRDFESGTFALNIGDISAPVKTSYGYHLIKLVDKRGRDLPPFDSLKSDLAGRLKIRAQEKFLMDYFEGLYAKYELTIHHEVMPEILTMFAEAGRPDLITMDLFHGINHQAEIAVWRGGAMNVAEYLTLLIDTRGISQIPPNCQTDIEDFIQNQVIVKLMVLEALELKLDQDPHYLDQLNIRRNQKMVSLFNERNIMEVITWTEAELKTYFDNHADRWGSQSYSVAKPRVLTALRAEKSDSLAEKLLDELYQKHPPVFNEELIEEFARQMNKLKHKQAASAAE